MNRLGLQSLKTTSYTYIRVSYLIIHTMTIGKVWIGLYLLLFVRLFVRLRISPPRIKLAASYFARRFIGVLGRESPIFCELCSPRIGRIGQRAGHAHPHVKRRLASAARTRRTALRAPSVYSAANGWQAPSENSQLTVAGATDRVPQARESSFAGARRNRAP